MCPSSNWQQQLVIRAARGILHNVPIRLGEYEVSFGQIRQTLSCLLYEMGRTMVSLPLISEHFAAGTSITWDSMTHSAGILSVWSVHNPSQQAVERLYGVCVLRANTLFMTLPLKQGKWIEHDMKFTLKVEVNLFCGVPGGFSIAVIDPASWN